MTEEVEGESHRFRISQLLNGSATTATSTTDTPLTAAAGDDSADFLKKSLIEDLLSSAPSWLSKLLLAEFTAQSAKLEGKATLQVRILVLVFPSADKSTMLVVVSEPLTQPLPRR